MGSSDASTPDLKSLKMSEPLEQHPFLPGTLVTCVHLISMVTESPTHNPRSDNKMGVTGERGVHWNTGGFQATVVLVTAEGRPIRPHPPWLCTPAFLGISPLPPDQGPFSQTRLSGTTEGEPGAHHDTISWNRGVARSVPAPPAARPAPPPTPAR